MPKTKGCITCGWFEIEGGEPHAADCPGSVVDMNVAPASTSRKTTVYVKPSDIVRLNEIAAEFGCVSVGGRNIGKPSFSALFRDIAAGKLVVRQP